MIARQLVCRVADSCRALTVTQYKYSNAKVAIPDFVVEPEYAMELLCAANFLDC